MVHADSFTLANGSAEIWLGRALLLTVEVDWAGRRPGQELPFLLLNALFPLMFMSAFCLHVRLGVMHLVSREAREGVGSLATGVTGVVSYHMGDGD